jgi:hypothetical protein
MLSVIAQLWDPLGLISPIIIKAKTHIAKNVEFETFLG